MDSKVSIFHECVAYLEHDLILVYLYSFLNKNKSGFHQKELRDEDQSYRRYLARILEDERRSEQELEKFIQQETEAAWQKRMCQWRTERQVRRNLLQEVITSRDKQVQERRKCLMYLRLAEEFLLDICFFYGMKNALIYKYQ